MERKENRKEVSQKSLTYLEGDYCRQATRSNYTSGLKVFFKSIDKNLNYADKYVEEVKTRKRDLKVDITTFLQKMKEDNRPSISISMRARSKLYNKLKNMHFFCLAPKAIFRCSRKYIGKQTFS